MSISTIWTRLVSAFGSGKSRAAPAAFAHKETPSENFDQTRSAGPEAMRTRPREWDEVDQAVDESFPASDPPSRY